MPEETVVGQQEAVDIESVDLSFENNHVAAPRPFVAEIRTDLKEAGNYGPQYHLSVHPLHKTDAEIEWHSWTSIPIRDGAPAVQGQFGETFEALRKAFGKTVPSIGSNLLMGRVGVFVFQPYEYYDKRAKARKKASRDSMICLREATAQDVEDALARQSVDTAGTPAAARPEITGTLTPDELRIALDIMVGRKPSEYRKGLMSNESVPQTVRNAVFDGKAKSQVIDAGLAEELNGVLVEFADARRD